MNHIKTYLQKLLVSLFALTALLVPAAPVTAQNVLEEACKVPESTLCKESKVNQEKSNNSIYGPNGIITKAVRLLSFVIGFAAVIMIMIGGFKYVISTGDSASVNSAKNTILYAVIGLVIAAMAQAIIVFVVNRL